MGLIMDATGERSAQGRFAATEGHAIVLDTLEPSPVALSLMRLMGQVTLRALRPADASRSGTIKRSRGSDGVSGD
jgi:hypothetical protein